MKKILLILTSLSMTFLFSLDYTIESTISGNWFEKADKAESRIQALFEARLIDKEKVSADFTYKITEDEQILNTLKARFRIGFSDIFIGKQQIGWGNGYNYNPTDIFNTKPAGASFDPTFMKDGRNALLISSYWNFTSLDLIYAFPLEKDWNLIQETRDFDAGARLKTFLFDYELALSYVYQSNLQYKIEEQRINRSRYKSSFGLAVGGSIPIFDIGLYGEGIYEKEAEEFQYVVGSETIFKEDFTFILEYYYNGFGAKNKVQYDFNNLFLQKALAKQYLAPSLQYIWNETFTSTAFCFLNLNDNSSFLGINLSYLYNDYVEMIALPLLLLGEKNSEYGMQKEEIGSYGIELIVKMNF